MKTSQFWKKVITCIIVAATVFSLQGLDEAYAKSRKSHPSRVKRQRVISQANKTDMYSDLVIEAQTGRILRAKNADKLRYPASLTKMMTLYVAFQALESGKLHLEQKIPVSSRAAAQSPSKLGLRPGQSIRVYDAIMGMATKSANDAACALAEAIGGSESAFARMMTRQARALGMQNTKFTNASGLPDSDQVTTARDMAILGHALIYHYPRYYKFFGKDSFTYAGQTHRNHNHLMERYDGMDGIKTGYIRASGFNLVASAVRGKTRLIGVIFGGRSTVERDNRMARLLDEAFDSVGEEITAARFEEKSQGDWEDRQESNYIQLPPKTAVLFASQKALEKTEEVDVENIAENVSPTYTNLQWGIQVGAYNDIDTGKQILAGISRDLPLVLGQTSKILQKVQSTDGTIVYRARFMGMEQATARSVCAYMVKHGQGCQVVAPEQAGS